VRDDLDPEEELANKKQEW